MLGYFFIILGLSNIVVCRKHSRDHAVHNKTHLTIELRPHGHSESKSKSHHVHHASAEKGMSLRHRTTPAKPRFKTVKYRHRLLKGQGEETPEPVVIPTTTTTTTTTRRPTTTEDIHTTTELITTTELSLEEEYTTTERITTRITMQRKATLRSVATYGWGVWCKMQPVTVDCDGTGLQIPRFYFDTKRKTCSKGPATNCIHNINQFNSFKTCYTQCKDYGTQSLEITNPDVFCRLQPEFGDCNDYSPMFYYDMNDRKCKGFSYSSCGGNSNRFKTMHQCTIVCGNVIRYSPMIT